jgi:diadenylate cyclase
MNFTVFFTSLLSVLRSISLSDILDVAIITVVVYYILKTLKRTRMLQILKAVGIVFRVYVLSTQLKMRTISWLIENLLSVAFITLLVVFRPEIRRSLEQLAFSDIFSFSLFRKNDVEGTEAERLRKAIAAICDGVEHMREEKTGALIVMEKFSRLENIKPSGTAVNRDITPELIGTIFYEGSPLHDGAMIIQNGRITYAGCVLPLSGNLEISKELGTRHRAALGLSEVSDAIILVVSEETGVISYAQHGRLVRRLDRESLYNVLDKEFVKPIEDAGMSKGKISFGRSTDENK